MIIMSIKNCWCHRYGTLEVKIMSQFIIDAFTQSYFSFQQQCFSIDCFHRLFSKEKKYMKYIRLWNSNSSHDNGYDKLQQPNSGLKQCRRQCHTMHIALKICFRVKSISKTNKIYL